VLLDLDRDRAPEGARILHEGIHAKVLDASGLELRHVGLTRAKQLRELPLAQPALRPESHELLLELHLIHELIDFFTWPSITSRPHGPTANSTRGPVQPVQPLNEDTAVTRHVLSRPR